VIWRQFTLLSGSTYTFHHPCGLLTGSGSAAASGRIRAHGEPRRALGVAQML
jgi:hypothetical protein